MKIPVGPGIGIVRLAHNFSTLQSPQSSLVVSLDRMHSFRDTIVACPYATGIFQRYRRIRYSLTLVPPFLSQSSPSQGTNSVGQVLVLGFGSTVLKYLYLGDDISGWFTAVSALYSHFVLFAECSRLLAGYHWCRYACNERHHTGCLFD